jgi:FKBP-type peptidyl-prolyl cis-trans isomerase FkpA
MRLLRVFVVFVAALTATACESGDNPTAPSPDPSVGLNLPFSATDITVGTGEEATLGRAVTVRYTGWLYHPNAAQNRGPQFDSGTYGPFVLGTTVIQGWTQGLQGMRVGGSRRLVIPPSLGYGPGGNGPIPGNATLLFEVTLLSVQ